MFSGIFWIHIRRSGFLFFLSLFAVLLSGGISLFLGRVIGHSVELLAGQGINHLFLFAVALFALFLSLIVAVRSIFSGVLGMKVVQGMSLNLYEALLKTKIEVIKRNAAQIPMVLASDMAFLQNFFGSAAPVLLRNTLTFLGAFVALFFTERQLFFYLIFAIPILFIPLSLIGFRVKKLSSLVASKADDFHVEVRESMDNIQMIKSFLKENFFFRRLEYLSRNFSSCFARYVVVRSVLIGTIVAASFSGTILFMDLVIKAVHTGEIGVATLSEFVFYALFASSSIGRIMELYPDLRQCLNILGRIERLYGEFSASSENAEVGESILRFEKLEFKDVCFTYSANGSDVVLEKLNFTIKRGEKVALVGPSGGGKSTIFALILGFYFPSSGTITINDIPVSEISLASLRKLFAWVPQELSVISGSLMENICMETSLEDQEESLYRSVCKAANITQFSDNTNVADFSRGQRQRVNIARAMFADREVTLLDEATSSLDAQNERDIETVISAIPRDRTVVTVAHRFSSIKCVDKVIVIEHGKVSTIGTHNELLTSSPFYKRMAEE